jgi:hypothetical protein
MTNRSSPSQCTMRMCFVGVIANNVHVCWWHSSQGMRSAAEAIIFGRDVIRILLCSVAQLLFMPCSSQCCTRLPHSPFSWLRCLLLHCIRWGPDPRYGRSRAVIFFFDTRFWDKDSWWLWDMAVVVLEQPLGKKVGGAHCTACW